MKNRIKNIIIALVFLVPLLSCSKEETITYNIYSKPRTIDPHQFRDMLSVQLMNEVYEGLLRLDENNEFKPALASSYSIDKTKMVYKFKIREEAKYSDGTKVEAKDVVSGIIRALDSKTAARYAEMLFPIKGAEEFNSGIIDSSKVEVSYIDNEVTIKLKKPVPYFEYILTLPISYPVKEMFKNDIVDIDKALYNGPYIISHLDDDKIILKKNKYYWDKDNVEIENVRLIPLKDYVAVENLIKNEELDLSNIDSFDFETKRKNNELLSFYNGRLFYLDFNMQNPILNKKENRLAISLSIDRKKYVELVKKDGSKVAKSAISEVLGNYRENYPDEKYFEDNISSNILKGKKMRLLVSNSTSEIQEANFIQEELRVKLGLEVEVTTVSFTNRLALTRAGDYDIVLNTYGPKFNDPLTMLYRWNRNKPHFNGWSKEKYLQLIKDIENETNEKSRLELVNKAERILIDEAVIAPLYYSKQNWFIRNKYNNIIVHPITGTMDIFRIKKK